MIQLLKFRPVLSGIRSAGPWNLRLWAKYLILLFHFLRDAQRRVVLNFRFFWSSFILILLRRTIIRVLFDSAKNILDARALLAYMDGDNGIHDNV